MDDDIKYKIEDLKREIDKISDSTSRLGDLIKEETKNLRYSLEEIKKDIKDIKYKK